MALENRPLEKEIRIEQHQFLGSMLVFEGVYLVTDPTS